MASRAQRKRKTGFQQYLERVDEARRTNAPMEWSENLDAWYDPQTHENDMWWFPLAIAGESSASVNRKWTATAQLSAGDWRTALNWLLFNYWTPSPAYANDLRLEWEEDPGAEKEYRDQHERLIGLIQTPIAGKPDEQQIAICLTWNDWSSVWLEIRFANDTTEIENENPYPGAEDVRRVRHLSERQVEDGLRKIYAHRSGISRE